MTANPAASGLTEEFQKRKSADRQRRPYSMLNAGEQGLANIFTSIALIIDPDSIEGTPLAQKFTDFLGLGNFGEFRQWQNEARQSGETPGQIASRLDYRNFDFAGTENALLDLIAQHEAGGNYNIVYGGREMNLTSMTIDEVLQWQRNYVNSGSPSSAAGRYQFVQDTLRGLKTELGLTGSERFDEEMQDRLAMALLERRGYSRFLNGEISEARFMRNLSQEWASLPKDMGGKSYYAGDGLNRALTSPQSVLAAMHRAREQHEQNLRAPEIADAQTDEPEGTTLNAAFSSTAAGTPPATADATLAFGNVPDPNADRSAKPPPEAPRAA